MKTGSAALQVRDFNLEELEVKAKADGDGYRLTGYGSVFGVQDSYSEVVAKGAFLESIAERGRTKRKLPMLWQHRSAEPIGVWDTMKEDSRGLYLEGDLLKGVQVAEEARIRAEAGAVTGLSIGYYVRDSSRDEKTGVVTLKRVDLIETSLVTFPANDDARVEAVKFMLSEGSLPDVKGFERFLRREAGFSKTQAALIVTKGFAELVRRESGSDDDQTRTTPSGEIRSALDAIASVRSILAKPLGS